MRGAAKHFNTLDDVSNSMAVDKEGTKARLRQLKEGRLIWVDKGPLNGVEGVTDATHKVLEVGVGDSMESQVKEFHQFALEEDPNAWMFRIGLTVEQIDGYLEA